MPDTKTTTVMVQQQILDAIGQTQEATLTAWRSWAEMTASVVPNMTEQFFPSRPDSSIAFAEKVWTGQREFMANLVEAVSPVAKAGPETARRAAAASERATAK